MTIYGENMHFFQKMAEKKSLKLIKKNISDLFLLKNSISGPKNSLKCKNFGQFYFFIVFIKIKSGKNKVDSHLRLFLAPVIEFLGKNTSEMFFFNLRDFFRIISCLMFICVQFEQSLLNAM